MFQSTPNTENFQARYIITHPATGDLSCAEGKKYLTELKRRRVKEMEMLAYLTGKDVDEWKEDVSAVTDEESNSEATYATLMTNVEKLPRDKNGVPAGLIVFGAVMLASAGVMKWRGMI
jgi:hypothetical protein